MLLLRLKLLVLILFCPFPFKFRKNFTSIPSRDCLACLTVVTRLYEKKAPFKRWVYKKCVDFFHVYCKSLFRKIIVSKRIPSPEVASPYSCSSPSMPMLPPVSISSKALPRVIPRISSTLGVVHTWGPLWRGWGKGGWGVRKKWDAIGRKGWGVSECSGRPLFIFFIKENWICALTRHHAEPNIL